MHLKRSFFYILGAALLFSTMEVAIKSAGLSFNAIQLTFLRFMIGGLVLLPMAMFDLKKRQVKLNRSDWLYLLLLGLICVSFSMPLFQLGIMRSNANLAAMIISTSPVFTMTFARLIIKEPFTIRKIIMLILNLAGLLIVADPIKIISGHQSSLQGILLTLAAAISFGLYTALGKLRIDKIGGIAQSSLSFLLGSTVLMVVLALTGQPILAGIKLESLPLLLYLGALVTGLGYYCYNKAIAVAGPSTASVTFFIKPLLAPLIAWLVLREPVTWNLIAGIIAILVGSIINFTERKGEKNAFIQRIRAKSQH